MKSATFFGLGFFSLLAISSCSNKSDETATDKGFVYQNYFLLDSIPKTLDPIEDAGQITELNEIPDSLIGKWVLPFRKRGQHNKMVSYQFGGDNYHLITIMIIDEMYIDKKNEEVSISLSSQYALIVKNDGSLIDGLKVEEGLSKDHLDDEFVNGMEIMSKYRRSEFNQGTIKTYDLTAYIKVTVLSEREDYIETPDGKVMGTLEKVLQEEFEGTDETTYVVDPNGKIKKLKEKKGELKKLSENTGERIKS